VNPNGIACGRRWADHVNAARADAAAGRGWRAVVAHLAAAQRAAATDAEDGGARVVAELDRALGARRASA